ncbi:MAG: hypothetical protein RhofKO_34750 [Rhodothermales bacterium]
MLMEDHPGTVLVVDDTPQNIAVLFSHLSQSGFKVLVAESGPSALMQAKHAQPDLILLDVMMPELDGFEVCKRLKRHEATQHIPVIFMTALDDPADKMRGFEVGGIDYITKPFEHQEVEARVTTHITLQRVQHALHAANQDLEVRVAERTAELSAALDEVKRLQAKLQLENQYLKEEITRTHDAKGIIGQSQALCAVLRQAERVATTDATVLILGETGTGKELFARTVHEHSDRRKKPLVKVNCAALPETLIESELFGHEKGAFTGAASRRIGRFELADEGTIFLDEIGDLPLPLQAKLLRILQEGEFERLGNPRTMHVDVRVIAATNRDLAARVREGSFREDLYYRLNVVPLKLPPLRDRLGDVPLLVRHVLSGAAKRFGRPLPVIPPKVMRALEKYTWPGNVRELTNVIERALILSDDDELQLAEPLSAQAASTLTGAITSARMEDVEREHIRSVLDQTGWQVRGIGGAAEKLGLNASTLRSRMKKLGIERPT